jgi:hypothetical protein
VNNKKLIEEKLLNHEAVLFRGFGLLTASDFNKFANTFGYESLPYH